MQEKFEGEQKEHLEKMHNLSKDSASRAYCPYSKFNVGACIFGSNGKYYTGCNVENVVNGKSLCAEGTAIVKMVEDGCREIKQVYVVTRLTGADVTAPCGLCRQHIKQFSKDDKKLLIHLGSLSKGWEVTTTLSQLLPFSFGPIALQK